MLEVEQKFRVDDLALVAAQLEERRIKLAHARLQVDRYFNHPSRDFAQTDEALRIRQVDQKNFVTYKGPKLDCTTKTRLEIELPIAPGDEAANQFGELLLALGFRPVAEVRKHRRTASLRRGDLDIEIALDDVRGVGSYVELECAAEQADAEMAKQVIATLAAELGLSENERKSYLELLLERP
jgi:adenylate cyclase, class 2